MKIRVYYDGTSFRIKSWKKKRDLIIKVISEEGKFSGDLNFILTDDDSLRRINHQFLNHDSNTDVISFNYEEKGGIGGEVYISVETVKKNADNYKVSYQDEMLRVMIHGTLHLCGYVDEYEEEKFIIHKREDFWIERLMK